MRQIDTKMIITILHHPKLLVIHYKCYEIAAGNSARVVKKMKITCQSQVYNSKMIMIVVKYIINYFQAPFNEKHPSN